jgi:uncharacterized protein involved in exopolysaccharide biosynthesis
MSYPTPTAITPLDILRVLFRHKGKCVAFFIGVLALTVVVTFCTTKVYRSESELFVRLGRENVTVDPVATPGQDVAVAIPQSREMEMNSLVEVLQNRTLLERVVDAVGAEVILSGEPATPGPAQSAAPSFDPVDSLRSWVQSITAPRLDNRERAVIALGRDLAAEPIKKSSVLRVSYETSNPEVAQQIVGKVVEYFLEQHIQLNRTRGAQQFLVEQADRYRQQLTDSEQQLCTLQNRTGLALPDAQRQLLVTRVSSLEDQLLQARVALDGSAAELRVLNEKLASLPATQISSKTAGVPDTGTDGMRQQRFGLEMLAHQRAAIYTEAHPKLQEIRSQLPAASGTLAQEPRDREQTVTSANRSHEEVQLALLRQQPVHSSLQAKVATLQNQLAQAQEQLRGLNTNALELARLQREVELQSAQWRKYAATVEQARLNQSLEDSKITNISLVQPATRSLKPVRPRVALNMILGLLAATFGTFGLALAAEYFDSSLKSVEELERVLEIPALTAIPVCTKQHAGSNGHKSQTETSRY